MHENAIARDLIDLAREQLDALPSPVQVRSLRVRVGVWSGVVAAALASAFPAAAHGTPLATSRLELEEVGLTVWCPRCESERTVPQARRLRCPVCGKHTPRIIHGTELELVAMELIEETEGGSHDA